MPRVKALKSKYTNQGLVVLGVHAPNGAEDLPKFLKQNQITNPVAIERADKKNLQRYHSSGYPTFTLIGRNGKVRYADVLGESLEPATKKLLREPAR